MKKLFVSFSVSGDATARHFVRSLLKRLNEQSIDAWIYESPGGRIRSGASIALVCRQKIEASEFFVVVVNDQALVSDYVAMEVSHALWVRQQRGLVIYPIVATSTPRSHWPPHIAAALGFRGMQKELTDSAVEDAVYDICLSLEIEYTLPSPVVVRLPLAKRVSDELREVRSASPYDANDFRKLLDRCDQACSSFERQDFTEAFELAAYILTELKFGFGVRKPYYPRVFMGAILLRRADAGETPQEDVRRFFSDLIAEGGERLDGNAFAGRAHALFALGRYDEALADYREAEARLDRPDPALLYNIARVQLLSGAGATVGDLERWRATVADGLLTTQPGDLSKITSVLALGHAHRGDVAMARSAWDAVKDPADVFPELVAEICHWLREESHRSHYAAPLSTARRILDDYLNAIGGGDDAVPPTLAHMRARVRFDLGLRDEARKDMDRLIRRCPVNPLFALDAAMFAIEDGDLDAARRHCVAATEVQDHTLCWPRLTVSEFKLSIGQAFWLLGREAEARENFRQSQHAQSLWYRETLPDAFNAANTGRSWLRRLQVAPYRF